MAKEQDLPKEYASDDWTDAVMELKKWKEKRARLEELNGVLSKISKLKPRTSTRHFVQLTKRLFGESIVLNQVLVMKTISHLANALRENFNQEARTVFEIMLKNLKTKQRSVNDQILKTIEKLFLCMSFEDVEEDIRENIKDKNNFKKLGLVKMFIMLIDKTNRINSASQAVRLVKLVIKFIDINDNVVRDKASQAIAKLKDKYNQKVQPLLSDLDN